MLSKWKLWVAAGGVLILIAGALYLRPEFLSVSATGPGGMTATLPEDAPAITDAAATTDAISSTTAAENSRIVRESYMQAFGRQPSPDEEKWWVGILNGDSRFRSVPVLVYNHRNWIKSNAQERSDSAVRAIRAVLQNNTIPSYYLDQLTQPGDLIYTEMVTRVILLEAYLKSFGRYPTDQELASKASSATSLSAMITALRNELKANQTTRQTVIKLAFQNVMSRQPTATELTHWDKEVAANGYHYTDLTTKVKTPIANTQPMPRPPARPAPRPQPAPAPNPPPTPAPAPPMPNVAAPLEFQIYTPFTTQTKLAWIQADEATKGFWVQRRLPHESGWTTIADRPADKGAYRDYGYQDSHGEGAGPFVYRVCAYGGFSEACTEAKAAPGPAQKPGLKATAATKSSITLQLTQVGTEAKQLKLHLQEGPNARLLQTFQATGAGGAHTYTHTGLQANKVYTYRACGWNDRGDVCTDWMMAATNPVDDIPVAPIGLQVTGTTQSEISLAFTQRGTGMTQLSLQVYEGNEWRSIKTWSPGADGARFTYTHGGLPPSTTRYYVACATNSRGTVCSDPYVTGQTQAPAPAAQAPRIDDVVTVDADSWRFTWAPTNQELELQFRADDDTTWQTNRTVRGASGSFDFTLVKMRTPIYYVRLCMRGTATCSGLVPIARQWDHPSNFSDLDYGLYWVKCGTCREDGKQIAVKADPRLSEAYFDPSRPTVIYVHGWQQDTVKKAERESFRSLFNFGADTRLQDLSWGWKNDGATKYNVGIFYWNQFADDDWGKVPFDTEQKLWVEGMRYKVNTGRDQWDWGNGGQLIYRTAPQLFADAYKAAMADYKGGHIRIVGHSLGHQMAVLLTKQLADAKVPKELMPDRVALLDAAYADAARGDTILSYIQALKRDHGIVFEQYDSSWFANHGEKLRAGVIYTRIYSDFAKDITHDAHYAAINWYFQSKQFQPPAYEGGWFGQVDLKKPAGYAPSAAMLTADLKKLESCNCEFQQWGDGKNTATALDDIFGRWSK